MKKRVGVLMGGVSCERDISIKSGTAVLKALKNRGVNVVGIELEASLDLTDYKDLIIQKIRASNIDAAFIALHGRFGEDGTIQKILEDINIPYTGSGVDASRLGMDKVESRDIFNKIGLPIPRYIVVGKDKTMLDKAQDTKVYFRELGSPLVVKPSTEGSSIGLNIVDSGLGFDKAIEEAFKYSDRIIIEEYVRGREITVGILQDKPLPIVEILPKKRFFDFEAKYNKEFTDYQVPAKLGRAKYGQAQEIGFMAHKALGARSFSRVDMILSEQGTPIVLELNTIPGLTEASLLPKAAGAAGISFEELVLKILESSLW